MEEQDLEQEKDLEFEEDLTGVEVIKKLRDKLKVCQAERQEYLDASQRLRADYVNLKRESENSRLALTKFANEKLLLELIGVVDNFEQAFNQKEVWSQVSEVWRKGVEQISQKLLSIIKSNGLETINPVNKLFDPNEAQAIATVDTNKEEEDNMVLEVLQKGYRLHGKVIRPASVKVGHYKN